MGAYMKIIGAGLGRTGTYSLKLALNQLGIGPCFHMEAVLQNRDRQVALWNAALDGAPDWVAIYEGFQSAVDWPTAAFYRELHAAYPDAKFVLTVRSPESWAESFSSTIAKLVEYRGDAPEPMHPWLTMVSRLLDQNGFPAGLSKEALAERFSAHADAVKAAIPEPQLLTFQVKEGWAPLCDFLGAEAPREPFPRTNDRGEFWDLVASGA